MRHSGTRGLDEGLSLFFEVRLIGVWLVNKVLLSGKSW
jgi:hypothetical protein